MAFWPLRWSSWFATRHKVWLKKRIPAQKNIRLSHRNIFILPTKAGWGFLVLTLLLWLLGTNYQNNLIIGLSFFLLALMWVCKLYTYANLSGLKITALHSQPGFVGDEGSVQLRVSREGKRQSDSIQLYWVEGLDTHVSLLDERSHEVSIKVPLKKRGWYRPGRLYIGSRFPLGLLVAWSRLDMDVTILAYPEPLATDQPLARVDVSGDEEEHAQAVSGGSEEFAGLRDYEPGDSPRHIAWKSLARGQGLASKHYEDYTSNNEWLDWQWFNGMDTEERLSRLCDLALHYAGQGMPYGLRLPGVTVSPARGEAHRLQVLEALALFGQRNGGEV